MLTLFFCFSFVFLLFDSTCVQNLSSGAPLESRIRELSQGRKKKKGRDPFSGGPGVLRPSCRGDCRGEKKYNDFGYDLHVVYGLSAFGLPPTMIPKLFFPLSCTRFCQKIQIFCIHFSHILIVAADARSNPVEVLRCS